MKAKLGLSSALRRWHGVAKEISKLHVWSHRGQQNVFNLPDCAMASDSSKSSAARSFADAAEAVCVALELRAKAADVPG